MKLKSELTYNQFIRNFKLYEYGGIELTGIYLELYEYITNYLNNIKKYELKGVQSLNGVVLFGPSSENLYIEYYNEIAWLDNDVCDKFKHHEHIDVILDIFRKFSKDYLNKNHNLNIKYFNTRGKATLMECVTKTLLKVENKGSYIKEI